MEQRKRYTAGTIGVNQHRVSENPAYFISYTFSTDIYKNKRESGMLVAFVTKRYMAR